MYVYIFFYQQKRLRIIICERVCVCRGLPRFGRVWLCVPTRRKEKEVFISTVDL